MVWEARARPRGVGTTEAVGTCLDTQGPGLPTLPSAPWSRSLWAGRGGLVCVDAEALLACDPPVIRREGADGAWRETASRQQIPISSPEHPHFWAPPCWPVSDSCL